MKREMDVTDHLRKNAIEFGTSRIQLKLLRHLTFLKSVRYLDYHKSLELKKMPENLNCGLKWLTI